MNILLISNLYPEPPEYGIAPDTKAVHYFAKDWKDKKHHVLVLHPYWNPIGNIKRFFNINTHSIKEYSIDGIPVIFGESQIIVPHRNVVSKFQQRVIANRFRRYIAAHYPSFNPDAVVVHFPILAHKFNEAFLKKDRSYGTLHGVDLRILSSLKDSSRKFLVTCINNDYQRIFYRSKVLSKQGLEFGLKTVKDNLIVSGIDESLIAPLETIQTKLAKKRDRLRLIYAGRINKQKRIDSVIKALSKLKNEIDFQFTLVGSGPEMDNLKALSDHLEISKYIHFVGQKARNEVSKYMSKSDVFIMLSKGETLGLVYLEAMGQGCLTIGSKGQGIDGIIMDDQNGFLCTPEDIDEICQTLRKVALLDEQKFNAIALSGYNTVSNMTSHKMADKYLKMIEIK